MLLFNKVVKCYMSQTWAKNWMMLHFGSCLIISMLNPTSNNHNS